MTFRQVRCTDIVIPEREDRQRKVIDTSDLEPSIKQYGVLQPIIIDDDNVLIAGERRLTASLRLGLEEIPVRYMSELTLLERKIVEFIENDQRQALTWQESCRAVEDIHKLLLRQNAGKWSVRQTALEIGMDSSWASKLIAVAAELHDERINKLDTIRSAYNMLQRRKERKAADALASIGEISTNVFDEPEGAGEVEEDDLLLPPPDGKPMVEISLDDMDLADPAPPQAPAVRTILRPEIVPAEQSILNVDFKEWVESYTGPSFNFIHCDFPYGVNLFAGKLSGRQTHFTYDDDSKSYWTLFNCLMQNLDKLLANSGHIMFWYSMDFHSETLEAFEERAPTLAMRKRPLIWHKTDNVGIISDPKRGPRNIYENALFGSREDRFIVKPVANVYGGSTQRDLHPSTKPEPMLRHFFQMFVDETTRMLDPTCGSGSSLRAAESLGAEHVLGLERDPEIAKTARDALTNFRIKRKVEKA